MRGNRKRWAAHWTTDGPVKVANVVPVVWRRDIRLWGVDFDTKRPALLCWGGDHREDGLLEVLYGVKDDTEGVNEKATEDVTRLYVPVCSPRWGSVMGAGRSRQRWYWNVEATNPGRYWSLIVAWRA